MSRKLTLILVFILLLIGCQTTNRDERIHASEIKEILISKEVNLLISKKEEIEQIVTAINRGIKIEGILDVVPSNLELQLIKTDNESERIWLWLENDDYNAMFMFADESSIGYNILKEDKTALLQLIFENQQ